MSTKTASFVFRLFSVLMILVLMISAQGVTSTHAADSMVNSLADTIAIDGDCTLREAVQNASNTIATNTDCAVGNSGATYNKDYVELFNRDAFTINMREPASTFASVLHTAPPIPFVADLSTESSPEITCGETIMEDTTLVEDLACPPGTDYAIVIGGSNLTLDLGGHVISGHAPGTGIFSMGQEGITIRNGTIEGFNAGVFIIETRLVTMENLTVRNLDISDPNHLIFGIQIQGSQNVVVRDTLFEFLTVAHKEAVEIFDSFVDVSNIEVRGGGAGVNFSFAGGVCDPVNSPSNGTVRNSRFYNIDIAGIEVACSSYAWIEDNVFSAAPAVGIGIQGDAPFMGDVTGLVIKDNFIHGTMIGIEFRGILDSHISNNHVFDNQIWGIAMRQSLGCITPELGWECFYSTANMIADNQTWGNGLDLYHYEDSLGNVWERNTCETKDGAEIPECTTPFVKSIVRASVSPTSAASVDFAVAFSEPVTGVTADDFVLYTTGVTGATFTGVTPVSGTIYTVTVNTGSGNGTIRLNVVDNNSIVDAASNPLGGPSVGDGNFATGEVYIVNKSAGADTTGVFRPSNGLLYLKNKNDTGFADMALNYGLPGDYPVVGDWDGNGTVTIGIYRNGYFYLRNENTIGFAEVVFPFGTPGDQPIAGDWNGDGVDTIGIFRPSTGQFQLRNSNDAGPAEMSFYLGNVGDVGIAGDWNGDGKDTTGVFRPSNGVIFLKDTNDTGFADYALNYGLPGDKPVMGDWDNDGVDTIGIYRNGTFYLRNENTNGFATIVFGLGNPGDMPIAGNWDGIP